MCIFVILHCVLLCSYCIFLLYVYMDNKNMKKKVLWDISFISWEREWPQEGKEKIKVVR